MSTRLADFVKAYDIRGLVGPQLDATVVRAVGGAFAQVIAVPDRADGIVVGHDMRPSSPELAQAFAQGAARHGVPVTLIGLCSTDEMYYASGALGRPGAMFTASHNPARYNGIKLCRAGARPIGLGSGLDEVRDLAQWMLDRADTHDLAGGAPAAPIETRDLLADYAAHLRSLVNLEGIRPLTVVVDAGNGMSGLTAPAVLGDAAGLPALPLRVDPLYFELDGTFPNHEANPLEPANLVDLQRRVVQVGADIGLAFDGDADRCFVVDEHGDAVPASAVTALVATAEIGRQVAAGTPAQDVRIVHNLISSRAVPEIVREQGATPVRTRVGHSYIKAQMAEHDAVFGGEHSAHYYFRDFWYADTGMLAAMHVLAALGGADRPLSEVMARFTRYVASGEINSPVPDVTAATSRVRRELGARDGVEADELDGLTLTHAQQPMWWLNLRPSNTEPLLRLNVEAQDGPTMEWVRDTALGLVREQPSKESR